MLKHHTVLSINAEHYLHTDRTNERSTHARTHARMHERTRSERANERTNEDFNHFDLLKEILVKYE